MIYGLAGASGTGKTTLAKAVAEHLDIQFVPSSISETAKRHGFDAVGALSLPRRMELQWHLLNDFKELMAKTKGPVITDRTPIDMVSYLMAEFDMHSHFKAAPDLLQEAEKYIGECVRASDRIFDFIFLLGRLPVYEIDGKRPPLNLVYQAHTDLIMRGCLSVLNGHTGYAIINAPNHDFRMEYVVDIIASRLNTHEKVRKTSRHIH